MPPLFTSPDAGCASRECNDSSNPSTGKSWDASLSYSTNRSGFNASGSRPRTADAARAQLLPLESSSGCNSNTSHSSISTRFLLGSPSNTSIRSNSSYGSGSYASSMKSDVYSPRMRRHSSAILSPIPGARPLTSPHLNPMSTGSILNPSGTVNYRAGEDQTYISSDYSSLDTKLGRDISIPEDGKSLSTMSSLTHLSARNSLNTHLLQQSAESLSLSTECDDISYAMKNGATVKNGLTPAPTHAVILPEIQGVRSQSSNMNALRIALTKPVKLNKLMPIPSSTTVK